MKYFHNENPQVTLWREKYEKLQQENEKLKADLSKYGVKFDELTELANTARQMREQEARVIEARVKEWQEYFNSLPWYKKMFYKFKR